MLIVSITLMITAPADCRSKTLDVPCSFINMGNSLHPHLKIRPPRRAGLGGIGGRAVTVLQRSILLKTAAPEISTDLRKSGLDVGICEQRPGAAPACIRPHLFPEQNIDAWASKADVAA